MLYPHGHGYLVRDILPGRDDSPDASERADDGVPASLPRPRRRFRRWVDVLVSPQCLHLGHDLLVKRPLCLTPDSCQVCVRDRGREPARRSFQPDKIPLRRRCNLYQLGNWRERRPRCLDMRLPRHRHCYQLAPCQGMYPRLGKAVIPVSPR